MAPYPLAALVEEYKWATLPRLWTKHKLSKQLVDDEDFFVPNPDTQLVPFEAPYTEGAVPFQPRARERADWWRDRAAAFRQLMEFFGRSERLWQRLSRLYRAAPLQPLPPPPASRNVVDVWAADVREEDLQPGETPLVSRRSLDLLLSTPLQAEAAASAPRPLVRSPLVSTIVLAQMRTHISRVVI